jgi:flavin-dependent dehydrogenase
VKYDVVIVGAGAAGSAAARATARAGLTTLCIEKQPLDRAGAHWINAVPHKCFRQAALDPPSGAELKKVSHSTTLVAGFSKKHVRFPAVGMLDVDMALLIARLRDDARAAGAEFREGVTVRSLDERSGGDNVLHTDQGELRARTVLDATGLGGLDLVGAPDSPVHICAAAQQQRVVLDAEAAREFLRRNNAEEGDNLIFTAIEGGYSIVNLCVEDGEVGLLTGSIPAQGWPPGHTILERFATRHADWIGPKLRGGAGPIPLRAALRPARGDVAALGDQGGHVYAAHGSSIGASLVAAEQLAGVLATGGTAEDWGRQWMRSHGGRFASAYLFFRFTMKMTPEDLGGLMESGLLSPERMAAGLLQETPRVRLKDLPSVIRGALAQRRVVGRLAPTVGRIAMAEALCAAYPGPQPWWEARMCRIME